MKCKLCNELAVSERGLCKNHFIVDFEKRVYNTIKNHNLAKKNDKIIVATSGGKDSLSVLYLMSKKFDVTALLIDEGINNYREFTKADLIKFCNEHHIKLKIVSFKDEFGKSLDDMIKSESKKEKPLNACTICGILRRYLLNKYSQDYDSIVLGHNLDDEVQAVMMNFLRGNLEISSRLGPKTGLVSSNKFTQRIKPLYFCSEKDVKIYSFLKGFIDTFTECPYSQTSYRSFVRSFINKQEELNKGTKLNIINNFLKMLPKIKKYYKKEIGLSSIDLCQNCGFPSKDNICKTCKTLDYLNLNSKIKLNDRK
jgi:uncharacterized protein (TIGR00269 family)